MSRFPDGRARSLPGAGRPTHPGFRHLGGGGAWNTTSCTISPTPTKYDVLAVMTGQNNNSAATLSLTGFTFREVLSSYSTLYGIVTLWLGTPVKGATSFGSTLTWNVTGSSYPHIAALLLRMTDPVARFRNYTLATNNGTATSGTTFTPPACSTPAAPNKAYLALAAVHAETGGSSGLTSGPSLPWYNNIDGTLGGVAFQNLTSGQRVPLGSATFGRSESRKWIGVTALIC